MVAEIDKGSGFCFGVVYAIQRAEEELAKQDELYCLGDIVHNGMEVNRLEKMGLKTIGYEQFRELRNTRVLIRAHGEPPETYKTAMQNNIELIDASCPVVLRLQTKIRHGHEEAQNIDGQTIIFGKHGHAEVNGLMGQTNGEAIVISSKDELDKVDFGRPISIFSQTTKSLAAYQDLIEVVKQRVIEATGSDVGFSFTDSICRQVANRDKHLRKFAADYDAILFISGQKSSNGKVLYEICKAVNVNTYFITNATDINLEWFANIQTVGVCGATSTPKWLMEEVADYVNQL